MAIGPSIYFNKYKDYSVDKLKKELEELQKYLSSDELKKERQEEIDKGVDDNNCIENVKIEIDVIKNLIKSQKTKFKDEELDDNENPRCPKCFFILKKYVYGKIKGEIDTDKYIKGESISSENKPTYYCNKCNYDYDKNLNLMTETLDKIIESFIRNNPFYKDLLKEFFNKLTNVREEEKISFLKKFESNKDLFNEFIKDILKSNNPESLFNIYKEKFQIENKEKVFIRKYKIDEEGLEYEVEEEVDFAFLKCPSCNERLMFLMPEGSYLYCNKCKKYYLNNNGEVGSETTSPYEKNDDVLY